MKPKKHWCLGCFIGAHLGLASGITGIGGGVYLAPILHWLKWGTSKEIAAATSVFILVNSFSGIMGQLTKLSNFNFIFTYSTLFLAVLIGGNLGSIISSTKLPQKAVRILSALVILYVSLKIGMDLALK